MHRKRLGFRPLKLSQAGRLPIPRVECKSPKPIAKMAIRIAHESTRNLDRDQTSNPRTSTFLHPPCGNDNHDRKSAADCPPSGDDSRESGRPEACPALQRLKRESAADRYGGEWQRLVDRDGHRGFRAEDRPRTRRKLALKLSPHLVDATGGANGARSLEGEWQRRGARQARVCASSTCANRWLRRGILCA